jgi:hypothetical protein
MYTTLITAIIAVFANDSLKSSYSNFVPFIGITIFCFIVAGLLGGLVASSIPFYTSFKTFRTHGLGRGNGNGFHPSSVPAWSIPRFGLDV